MCLELRVGFEPTNNWVAASCIKPLCHRNNVGVSLWIRTRFFRSHIPVFTIKACDTLFGSTSGGRTRLLSRIRRVLAPTQLRYYCLVPHEGLEPPSPLQALVSKTSVYTSSTSKALFSYASTLTLMSTQMRCWSPLQDLNLRQLASKARTLPD